MPSTPTDIARKQLRYRSWHRGCKETDLILGQFCDRYVDELNEQEIQELAVILDEEDADLYQWLIGQTPIPTALENNSVLQRLMRFEVNKHLRTDA